MIFSALDWSIIAVYVVFSVGAGLYGKRHISGLSDFLVAGRGIGVHLGVATPAATEIGTVTFMYYAELGYKTACFVNGLIAGRVMIAIGRTGFIIKRLRALRLMSVRKPAPSRNREGAADFFREPETLSSLIGKPARVEAQ